MAMTREIQLKGAPSLNRHELKCEQPYFSPDGTPLAWYYRNLAGEIELFLRPGKHPQFNDELFPVNKEIVWEICQGEAKAKEAALLENQIKNELVTLRQNQTILESQNQQLTADLMTNKAKNQPVAPVAEVKKSKAKISRKAKIPKSQPAYIPAAHTSRDKKYSTNPPRMSGESGGGGSGSNSMTGESGG
jgi:hypothetical protein